MNWDQGFEDNGYKPAAAPMPSRPDPGVAENGKVACNEPLWVAGKVIGHCGKYMKRHKPHRGPHRIEWWTS